MYLQQVYFLVKISLVIVVFLNAMCIPGFLIVSCYQFLYHVPATMLSSFVMCVAMMGVCELVPGAVDTCFPGLMNAIPAPILPRIAESLRTH